LSLSYHSSSLASEPPDILHAADAWKFRTLHQE
jgi:hypothetical protein